MSNHRSSQPTTPPNTIKKKRATAHFSSSTLTKIFKNISSGNVSLDDIKVRIFLEFSNNFQ